VLCGLGIDQLGAVRLEIGQRTVFIAAHEARETRDIGRDNGGQSAARAVVSHQTFLIRTV
jgi:hypothetical protein